MKPEPPEMRHVTKGVSAWAYWPPVILAMTVFVMWFLEGVLR